MRATRLRGTERRWGIWKGVLKGARWEPLDCIFFCYKESNRVQVFCERRGIYRGKEIFPPRQASNLQKLSRNKFCIHSRDTFHSRRLPRKRPTLIPCLASLPFRGPSIYLNCNLSIVKLIVCVFPYVCIIFQISLINERTINIVRGRVGELEEEFKKSVILFFSSKRIANSFEF